MKTLLLTAALATMILRGFRTDRHAQPRPGCRASLAVRPAGWSRGSSAAFGGARHQAVYDNNHYLGADPDPNVRLDLRRDFEGRDF